MERADLEIDLLTLPSTRKNGKQDTFDVIESQLRVLTWRNSSNSMKPSPLSSKTLKTKLKRVGDEKYKQSPKNINALTAPPVVLIFLFFHSYFRHRECGEGIYIL